MSDQPRQQSFDFTDDSDEPAQPLDEMPAEPLTDEPIDDGGAAEPSVNDHPVNDPLDGVAEEANVPRPTTPSPHAAFPAARVDDVAAPLPEELEGDDAPAPAVASARPLEAAPLEVELPVDSPPRPPPPLARTEARPAPVVTDEGDFWFPGADDEALAQRELRAERWTLLRHAGAWIAGIALVAVATAALGAHSVVQATGEEVALPALRRAVEALAQPEALLELHREAIAEGAADAESPDTAVEVPGYPVVGVALTAAEATGGDLEAMRDALLDRSTALVHAEGRSAFAEGGLAPPASDRLSTAGAVAGVLDGLTAENHDRWSGWQTTLVVLAALLGAAVLALPRGFGGVLGLGAALIAAGLAVAGAALGLRVALSLAGGEGPLLDEYLRISRELTRIPLRNGLALAGAGVALALPAALLRALFERSVTRDAPSAARREIEL